MFSQNEILLMIFVVSVLLIFIVVLTILDIREYRKNANSDTNHDLSDEAVYDEIVPKKNDEVTTLEVDDNTVSYEPIEKNANNLIDLHEEEYFIEEKNDEPIIEEVENNFEPIIEEVENNDNAIESVQVTNTKENTSNKVNLYEELTKIEETMVDENDVNDKVVSFEEEQERTAIISLNELLEKSDDLYNENELVQYDDGNEPISIDEVINMYNKDEKDVSVPEVMQEIVYEKEEVKKDLYTKKEDIPFISSIYGIEKDEMSFENTATYEKLDREKSNEFMRELKERIENQ